jgi:hypothetical protein
MHQRPGHLDLWTTTSLQVLDLAQAAACDGQPAKPGETC